MNDWVSFALFYFLNVVAMYLLIKWSMKYEKMVESDFSFLTTTMWIPLIQTIVMVVLFFVTLGDRSKYIRRNGKHNRRFREALFGVEKVDGKYQKKKVSKEKI